MSLADPKDHPKPPPWSEFKTRVRTPILTPLYTVEWICGHLAHHLAAWSFLYVLECIGTLSLIFAAISWFAESGERVKQRHYQAWQVINTAQGKGGSGGRIEALEQLAEDKVPLTGVDVSGAFLQNVRLDNTKLRRATFEKCDLRNAHFHNAHLEDADFQHANLRNADLSNADLSGADLTDADLTGANLANATLSRVILEDADLTHADLTNIKDWQHIDSLHNATLDYLKNPPPGFFSWATAQTTPAPTTTPKPN